MANLNKVLLIGRLTRDPERRTFANGGAVTHVGFAVNNSKKNPQTGQWEDEPVFLDCEAFNRGENGTLADRIADTLRKGQQIFIEGRLKLDQWNDKATGEKRSRLKIVIDNFQYLERREDGGSGGMGGGSRSSSAPGPRRHSPENYDQPEPEMESPPAGGGGAGGEEDIPF